MKRLIQLVALFLLLSISTFAQQAVTQSVITLKTGERYRGEIVMRTDEILMLKTGDGKRYQFRVGEIEKIKQETLQEIQVDANGNRTAGSHFAGIISVKRIMPPQLRELYRYHLQRIFQLALVPAMHFIAMHFWALTVWKQFLKKIIT